MSSTSRGCLILSRPSLPERARASGSATCSAHQTVQGHIKIYSEVGCGTTVKIYPPRLIDRVATTMPIGLPVVSAVGAGEVILVVEDEHMMPKFTTEGRDVVSSRTLRRSVWRAHHEAWQQPPSPKLLCLHELGLNPAQRSGVYEYRLEYWNTAMECMNTMARTVDSRA
jgi:hypothetical protein